MDDVKKIYSLIMQRDEKSLKNYIEVSKNKERMKAREIREVAISTNKIYTFSKVGRMKIRKADLKIKSKENLTLNEVSKLFSGISEDCELTWQLDNTEKPENGDIEVFGRFVFE